MSSPYDLAKQQGYTQEEIETYLIKKDPRYGKALEAGYAPEEIHKFITQKNIPKESLKSNISRQAGRTGARIAETVLGAPRALGEFGESIVPEKIIKKGAEKIGLKEPVEKAFELTKKYAPYKLFPKSEDIRENITKKLFGEKLEPKNKWEEKADEIVSDFAALAIPLPGSQMKLLKPAALALGGNIASEVVKKIGGTNKQQTYAKLGTILTGSLINPGSAKKLSSDLYKMAQEARPSDAKIKASNLLKKSDNFEKQLLKGDPSAKSKSKSLSLIKDIKSKVRNNEINIDELEQFKRDINESRAGLYEEFKTDKVGRKSTKRNLDTVSKLIDDTLNEYGKINPEWESFYRPANEVHGAIAQSKRVRNSIGRHAKQLGFPALLAELGLVHTAGVGPAVATAGAAAGALATGEIMARILKSSTLRKHYMNIINGALKDDEIVISENLKKLDEELKKENY